MNAIVTDATAVRACCGCGRAGRISGRCAAATHRGQSGDPFALVRVIDLVARLERGRPILIDDLVAALNGAHLDWLFSRSVVADALIALQANWIADYRNVGGFELGQNEYGDTLTVEDSPRVDPSIGGSRRAVAACQDCSWHSAAWIGSRPMADVQPMNRPGPNAECLCPGRAR